MAGIKRSDVRSLFLIINAFIVGNILGKMASSSNLKNLIVHIRKVEKGRKTKMYKQKNVYNYL